MSFLAILLGAAAAFGFGAFYYGYLSAPWKESSKVPVDADGNPQNMRSPVPYVTSGVALLVVAFMMRYVFAHMGVTSLFGGLFMGGALGLFLVTPWLALFHGYSMTDHRLTLINGGYVTIGGALMGAIIGLFL